MIPRAAREALEETLGDRVRFRFPLARCTSRRVGGTVASMATIPPQYWAVFPSTVESTKVAVAPKPERIPPPWPPVR